MKISVLAALLLAAATLPAAAQSGPSVQEQMACRGDASKFACRTMLPTRNSPSVSTMDVNSAMRLRSTTAAGRASRAIIIGTRL